MWLDPASGQVFGKPEEWEEAIRTADPLMRKAWLHPAQLTPDEKNQLALRLLSSLSDYLPDSSIRELIEESATRATAGTDPAVEQAARQMFEGKLAARELRALRQKRLEMGLLNLKTGKILTAEDVAIAMKQSQAKRRKKAAGKMKPRTTGKRKRAGQAVGKPAKPKRRKRR